MQKLNFAAFAYPLRSLRYTLHVKSKTTIITNSFSKY